MNRWIYLLALLPLPASADLFNYSFATEFASNAPLLGDNWIDGVDQAGWIAGDFSGLRYSRNSNDGDNTIVRTNDAGFSYTIPAEATAVSLTMRTRNGAIFWEAGFAASGTPIIGAGSDFNLDNKYFILDGGVRFAETGTTATADTVNTVLLEVDLVNSLASLSVNATPLITGQAVTLPAMTTANSLFIRTSSRFGGVGTFTIQTTVVPEPVSGSLAAFGLLPLLLGRRLRAGRPAND